ARTVRHLSGCRGRRWGRRLTPFLMAFRGQQAADEGCEHRQGDIREPKIARQVRDIHRGSDHTPGNTSGPIDKLLHTCSPLASEPQSDWLPFTGMNPDYLLWFRGLYVSLLRRFGADVWHSRNHS